MRKKWRWIGVLATVFFASASIHIISKAHCFQLLGDVICKAPSDRKIVALTFDDGPTPEGVSAVLPILEQHGVKATFFLIGNRMERYPEQARRILDAGHELGNHTYSHKRNLFRSQAFYRDEVLKNKEILKSYGSDSRLFRPPFGKRLIGLSLVVDQAGYTTIMWDVADKAESYPEPADYARDIVSRVEPGSIILIHPMYRSNQTARDALPLVLKGLKRRGFEVVPVSKLIELSDPGP